MYFEILLLVRSTLHYQIDCLITFLKSFSIRVFVFNFRKKINVQCNSKIIYLLLRHCFYQKTMKRLNTDEVFPTIFISPARIEIWRGGAFHRHNAIVFWLSSLLYICARLYRVRWGHASCLAWHLTLTKFWRVAKYRTLHCNSQRFDPIDTRQLLSDGKFNQIR